MQVGEIMSTSIVTVGLDTPFKTIWKKIFLKHIHSLPVVDKNNKLIGLISRQDILKSLYPKYQDVMENLETERDFEAMEERMDNMEVLKAQDLMSKSVIFTRRSTLIMRALSRMIVRNLAQLPVVDNSDKVVGIITKGDIFYSLFQNHFDSKKSKRAGSRKKRG
jgi:CBS-domain-containing membrane protein